MTNQTRDATSVDRNKTVSRRWIELFNERDDAGQAAPAPEPILPGLEEQPSGEPPPVNEGEPILLNIINETAWPHAMHYHGHHFKVIARTGKDSPDPYWWDTVLMQRNEEMVIAFVADNPGKWMIHCHMLEHQAGGMATWFEVTA